MAEQLLSSQIDDITQCCICTDLYKTPKVLPCIHTFCLACIKTYTKDKDPGETATCPVCRQEFTIPAGGVTRLPGNFLIDKFLDLRKISTQEVLGLMCDLCADVHEADANKAATWQCINCAENLCNQCCKAHQRQKIGRTHKMVEIGNKETEHLLKVTPSFCEDHPDKLTELYCNDCRKVICYMCHVIQHKTHDCDDINKLADTFRDVLQIDIQNVSEKAKICKLKADSSEKQKEMFVKAIAQNETEIVKRAEDLTKKLSSFIQSQTGNLLQEVQSLKAKTLKEIVLNKDEITQELLMLDSYKRYASEVYDKATSSDICRVADDLHNRADQLNDMSLTDVMQSYRVRLVSSDNLESLLTSNIIGSIEVTNSPQQQTTIKNATGLFN